MFIFLLFVFPLIFSQFFDCPPILTLKEADSYGNENCSDFGENGNNCDNAVSPSWSCSFSIISDDSSISIAELHIIANHLSNDDLVSIKGVHDSITSKNDGASFQIRAAFPFPGNPTDPIITISIRSHSASKMTFGYFVKRNPAPSFISKTNLEITKNSLAQFIQMKNANYGDYWTVGPSTDVVVTSAVSYVSSQYDLLNVWIWKNMSDSNLVLYGSAFSPSYWMEPITDDLIILQYVLKSSDIFDGTIIVNDYSNYYSCQNFEIVTWSTSPSDFTLEIDDDGGTYCFTVLNSIYSPEITFLDFIAADSTEVTQLIAGAPMKDPIGSGALLATYGPNSTFTLPQRLSGFATTIMVKTQATSVKYYIKGPEDAIEFSGQKGFLITPGYPYQMENQKVQMTLSDKNQFIFTYTVINSLSPEAIITINGSTSQIHKVAADINSSFSFVDTFISLEIDGGSGISGGVYITYSTESVNTTTTIGHHSSTSVISTTVVSSTLNGTTSSPIAVTTKAASLANLCLFTLMLRLQ